jgi:hypothetical protein
MQIAQDLRGLAIPFIDEKASIARCVSPKGRYKKIGLQQALGVKYL